MLGNFSYCNPTKLHFGPEALDALAGELAHYGKRVQLIYGGGSIKKNGIYDQVVSILKAAGKEIFEDPGVMPRACPSPPGATRTPGRNTMSAWRSLPTASFRWAVC